MSETDLPTIVVPTDFSESSVVATSFGSALSKILHQRLLLVHVFTYIPRHRYAVPVDWMVAELRGRAKDRLALAQAEVERSSGGAETVLLDAQEQPADEILKVVAKYERSILVVGTHSRSGLDRFFVGSTAEQLLRHAKCPVITVGPHVKPFWDREIQRLILATDLTERSLGPLQFLVSLWSPTMHLLVLHVASPDAEITSSSWCEGVHERLVGLLGEEAVRMQVEFRLVVHSSTPEAIGEAAEEDRADLVAIGVHPAKAFTAYTAPRTGFQIVMSAPCPVLSVCE